MKAVQLTEIDQIEIRDVPIPTPKQDEILIKVAAVGINPVDWKIATGQLSQLISQTLPLTLGWDVAGEVVESGNGYLKGDRVFGMKTIGQDGTLSEYCAIKRTHLTLVPKELPLVEAAALPMVALTSWQALFTAGNVRHGQRILIQAGAGGIGTTAIQLAKTVGAFVIVTTSDKNKEFVTSLGADEVIDYQKENFVDCLKDNPVDVVFETLSGDFQLDAIQVIKPKGKLVSISGLMQETIDAAELANIETEFIFVEYNAIQLKHLMDLIECNKFKANIGGQYHVDDIHSAYEESKQGRVRGKLVATF
ncbi:NADP-dependent oxidoreductase [Vibrio sp. ZSDE26]|uniref:NADP-dependent oxidoreductase n=1 Tax=Vibrio amylolyticus TaxID=2847292 RepID=A0A9X1XJU3_9VIBR|nr:NADP-dependent oxidoreductase [Vibrio amylolyticus]MCK6262978.1 NADP-dependent oxidoreductase [Vibrio amylolyticus]